MLPTGLSSTAMRRSPCALLTVERNHWFPVAVLFRILVGAGSGADLCCVRSPRNTDRAGVWIIPRWAQAMGGRKNLSPNPSPFWRGERKARLISSGGELVDELN